MELIPNFTFYLSQAQSTDNNTRKEGERIIRELRKQDEIKFLNTIVTSMLDEQIPPECIQLASILFKNMLLNTNKDDFNLELWQKQSEQMRQFIKEAFLSGLMHQNKAVMKAVAQSVSVIAALEVPKGLWPDILGLLCKNASSQQYQARYASIQCLGFFCEFVDCDILEMQTTCDILMALINNFIVDQPELIQIATEAFGRTVGALPKLFTLNNDFKEYVLAHACDTILKSNIDEVQIALLQSLCEIATLAYDNISIQNISQISQIAQKLVNEAGEEQASLAIEVWTSICDVEYNRMKEQKSHQGLVTQCASDVINIILQGLNKYDSNTQDTQVEELQSSITTSAAMALESAVKIIGTQCIQTVLDYAGGRISSPDWGHRYVSLLALSSTFEGPDQATLTHLLQQIYPIIMQLINDPVPKVRHAAAYALYRVTETFPQIIYTNQDTLENFFNTCKAHLGESHLIAGLIAGALRSAIVAGSNNQLWQCVLNHVPNIVPDLFTLMYSQPFHDGNDINQLSQAINDIVHCTANQQLYAFYNQFLFLVLQQIQASMDPNQFPLKINDESKTFFQSILCGLAQVILIQNNIQLGDDNENSWIGLAQQLTQSNKDARFGSVLLINALTHTLSANQIMRHMSEIGTFIFETIHANDDDMACKMACGLVCDMCNQMGEVIAPVTKGFFDILKHVLQGNDYTPFVKAEAFIGLGDLFLAIERKYEPYIIPTIQIMSSAQSAIQTPVHSEIEKSSLNRLRDALIESFDSFVQGAQSYIVSMQGQQIDQNQNQILTELKQFLFRVIDFVEFHMISPPPHLSPLSLDIIKHIYDIVCDILSLYPQEVSARLRGQALPQFLIQNIGNIQFQDNPEASQQTAQRIFQTLSAIC